MSSSPTDWGDALATSIRAGAADGSTAAIPGTDSSRTTGSTTEAPVKQSSISSSIASAGEAPTAGPESTGATLIGGVLGGAAVGVDLRNRLERCVRQDVRGLTASSSLADEEEEEESPRSDLAPNPRAPLDEGLARGRASFLDLPPDLVLVGLLNLLLGLLINLLLFLGPKRGAEEETTISNESCPECRTERSNCLDHPNDDSDTTGAAGGTSKEKSKDSRCKEIPASNQSSSECSGNTDEIFIYINESFFFLTDLLGYMIIQIIY